MVHSSLIAQMWCVHKSDDVCFEIAKVSAPIYARARRLILENKIISLDEICYNSM